MKKIIFTKDAPVPVGPYSQAVEVNGILFVAGQVAIDPVTGKFTGGGIQEQTDLDNEEYWGNIDCCRLFV